MQMLSTGFCGKKWSYSYLTVAPKWLIFTGRQYLGILQLPTKSHFRGLAINGITDFCCSYSMACSTFIIGYKVDTGKFFTLQRENLL